MVSTKTLITATLATIAASAPLEARDPTVLPTTLSLWNSGASRVAYSTTYGLAQRIPNSRDEFSTLNTFTGLSAYSGRQCQLIFDLGSSATVSGTGNAQVFFNSKAAAPGATSDFRDSQLATLKVVAGGRATWGTVDGRTIGSSLQLPCDTLIAKPNLEVAPQGERDNIYWPQGDGLKIYVI